MILMDILQYQLCTGLIKLYLPLLPQCLTGKTGIIGYTKESWLLWSQNAEYNNSLGYCCNWEMCLRIECTMRAVSSLLRLSDLDNTSISF